MLLVLAGVGLLTKPFWKRIATFFRRWWERDMRAEQLRREEAECRRKAQQEVSDLCHDNIRQGKASTPLVENAPTEEASTLAEHAAMSGQAAAPPPVATLRLVGNDDFQDDLQSNLHNHLQNNLQNAPKYEAGQERERK